MAHKTDWFYDKKWGLFIHLLGGGRDDWGEYIDSLDVNLLADQISEVNAGYLFLTVMQRSKSMLSPNETFDRITGYKPGEACAKRDFIGDMTAALNKRGIDLLLYYTGDGPLDDPQAGKAFGYVSQNDKVSFEFVEKWASVAKEYSLKYGTKAWWVDGCYENIGYDEPRLKILADAIRAGNPDSLVALNCGVMSRVSAYSRNDDFVTGEMNDFSDMPDGRFINGTQWHILSYLGIPPDGVCWNGWCKPGCKYTGEYLSNYVTNVHNRGGIVTIDVYMRDSLIDKSQMNTLMSLRDLRK